MNEEIKEKEINTNCDCGCNEPCNCDESCECKNTDEKNHECTNEKNKKHKDKKDKKLIEALNKINELEEKLIRSNADMINYRKRKEEETSKMLKYSNEDLVKALLPTIDNFERAIKMDDDNLEDEVSKFLEGFKMVYCNFNEVLKTFEIKCIDQVNVEFDPNIHNAIMVEKRDNVESGIILEILQKGYMLKDKVIRPAMVKVSE